MLARLEPTREQRISELAERGYPCYTTSAGWLGYDDAKLARLCREAVDAGWDSIKIKVATGEAVHNRIMFKQLLEAEAIDVLQLDATRVGGVNENLAILLMAARFGVPVCPHAGGVGLCELVQHYSFFDYAAVTGTQEGRFIEYVDHLHEHFAEPVRVAGGRYLAPTRPGNGAEMLAESRERWTFPDGPGWREIGQRAATTSPHMTPAEV
jgi:L-fuconate dehydratase